MKKVALSLLAFGLIGAGAFAQAAPAAPTVTIGDWGVQAFGIGNQDKSGYWAGLASSWDTTPRIVGLNIQAKTDTAGFSITPDADNGSFGLTDQNKAWVNPFPGWTVEGGIQLETDTWRGTNDFGSDDWLRFAGFQQNSYTFFRLGEGGTEFDINYNKDGIGGWALVSVPASGEPTDNIGDALQAGAAYTIASVGMLKAQYVGYDVGSTTPQTITASTVGDGTAYSKYQIAFNLSAIKDLSEEVGILLPSKASDAGWSYQVSDFADYKLDKLSLHGVIIVTSFTGDNNATSSGIGAAGSAGFDYDLGNSYTFTASVTAENKLAASGGGDGTDGLTGVLVGVSKGFSNGSIGIGFEYSTGLIGSTVDSSGFGANGTSTTSTNSDSSKAHWAIPIVLHEWF